MEKVFTGEWYPWYPEKALTSESIDGLSLAEEGAYRRALDKAWIKGSIPANPKDAAAVIGKGCSVKIAAKILTLFVPIKGNKSRVVNLSQERKRAEQAEKHKKAVKRAENAANKRWSEANKNKGADATSIPQAMLKDAIKNKSKSKDKEEEKNTHTTHACETAWEYPVKNLIDAFPDYLPDRITPAMIGFIESDVGPDDAAAWNETITLYRQNFDPLTRRYLPDKIGTVMEVFRKKKAEHERERNGNGINRNNANGSKQHLGSDNRTAADVARQLGVNAL